MLSWGIHSDNLFRSDRKRGAYAWANDVKKNSGTYAGAHDTFNNFSKENANEVAQDLRSNNNHR